jgi:hypothetical protein
MRHTSKDVWRILFLDELLELMLGLASVPVLNYVAPFDKFALN